MALGAKRLFIDDNHYTDYCPVWAGWFIKRDYRIVCSAYEPNELLKEDSIHISDVSDELKVFLEKED